MATRGQINDFFDLPKFEQQLAIVEEGIQEYIDKISKIPQIRTNVQGAEGIKSQSDAIQVLTKANEDHVTVLNKTVTAQKEVQVQAQAMVKAEQEEGKTLAQNIELRRRLQNSLEGYLKDQKDDLQLLKDGTINRAEYNKRLTESQVKIEQYKVRVSELNKEIKTQIVGEKELTTAYQALSKEAKTAQDLARNYAIVLGKTHPETVKARENAKALSDQLKGLDNEVGVNNRNVGNYAEAIGQSAGKVFGYIRQIAYIIPGLGIAGIFDAAFTGVSELIKGMIGLNEQAENSVKVFDALTEQLEDSKKQMEGLVDQVDFLNKLGKINIDISFKTGGEVLDLEGQFIGLQTIAQAIKEQMAAIGKQQDENLRKFGANEINLETFQKSAQALRDRYADLNLQLTKNSQDQQIKNREIELQKVKDAEEANKKKKDDAEKAAKELERIAEANRRAEYEILKGRLETWRDYFGAIADNDKKGNSERILALEKQDEFQKRLIIAQMDYELGAKKLTEKEKLRISEDAQNSLFKLIQQNTDRLAKLQSFYDPLNDGIPTFGLPSPAQVQAYLDRIKAMTEENTKEGQDAYNKTQEQIKNDRLKLINDLEKEGVGLAFDLFTASLEKEKNAIQDQIDLLDKKKQKDIDVATATIANAQDRATAIAEIEAKSAAEKEQLERQQREVDQRKARFDKAEAVANIIQNTSVAVTKALSLANPGLVALSIALGAVQLARVIATPIPKYKHGTPGHPGGIAEVGDGNKSEAIILPNGRIYKTAPHSQFVDIPKGSHVHPDFNKFMMNKTIYGMRVGSTKELEPNNEALERMGREIVSAIQAIPATKITGEGKFKVMTQRGQSFREYLNNRV